MIYTNFVQLYCLMLHAKFQNHRPSGSGEEDFKGFAIYSHGAILAILVSDQKEVFNVFNSYFVNVAKDIGKDCKQYDRDFSTHPSIQNILKNGQFCDKNFSFRPISENETKKIFSKLNVKKSTGVDNISAKLLKACAPSLSHAVSSLINLAFAKGIFPSRLKNAQVIPLYKEKDSLNKENYRPVSILPTTSKIFERVIHEQLSEYLDDMFNPF